MVNYKTLFVTLAHLIRVVQNCEKNKMNIKNISIIFSPTLGIPAGIFTLMMAEFPSLFQTTADIDAKRGLLSTETTPNSAEVTTNLRNYTKNDTSIE